MIASVPGLPCERCDVKPSTTLLVGFAVDDAALSLLHARAFGNDRSTVDPWADRLQQHSLSWVGAFAEGALIGFVNVAWDGNAHAFLLDTAVDPDFQHRGIGQALVRAAADEALRAGCEWLHVDFEPQLGDFYRQALPFRSTEALILHLPTLPAG
jgi:ribosomal protein S18 acetylase RimI-like enzyme